jgi:hypothetical protein
MVVEMKKPAEATAPNPGPSLDESATINILKTEYTALLNLYAHTEDTIFSIFNFYLTLLSAVVGAIIVLIQINSADLSNALPSIGGLLAATVLIGVIMQDAIVNKNIELSTHVLGINLLKKATKIQTHTLQAAFLVAYSVGDSSAFYWCHQQSCAIWPGYHYCIAIIRQ